MNQKNKHMNFMYSSIENNENILPPNMLLASDSILSSSTYDAYQFHYYINMLDLLDRDKFSKKF